VVVGCNAVLRNRALAAGELAAGGSWNIANWSVVPDEIVEATFPLSPTAAPKLEIAGLTARPKAPTKVVPDDSAKGRSLEPVGVRVTVLAWVTALAGKLKFRVVVLLAASVPVPDVPGVNPTETVKELTTRLRG
jgi:hypothetical protein